MGLQNGKKFCLFEEEVMLEELSEEEKEEWLDKEDEEKIKSPKKKKTEDPIKIYFKEVFSHKLLTREDEIRIGEAIERNEREILKEVLNFLLLFLFLF